MISVIGMGPGDNKYITVEAVRLIESADIIVGAKRHLTDSKKEQFELTGNLKSALDFIEKNKDKEIVVLASGEPKLYGIAKYLSKYFEINVISGISAIQYIFSKINLDMNDLYITSSHGKEPDIDLIAKHSKVAMVTDEKNSPAVIAEKLLKKGFDKKMIVGENLSYNDEKISYFESLEDVVNKTFNMNTIVIYD